MFSLVNKLSYYTSIDEMPIYNWFKVQETNDLKYVLKVDRKCNKKQLDILTEAMRVMQAEYIDTFGINESYKKILDLKREILELEIKLLITEDRTHQTFIDLKNQELKYTLSTTKTSQVSAVKRCIEKDMGFPINMKTTSVKEFYGIMAEIIKEAEHERSN